MIKLITDVSADIPKRIAEEYDIEILPLNITLDDKEIRADKDLKPKEFYDMLKNSTGFPTTSQLSPAEIEDVYRKFGSDGTTVIHIPISSKGSGTFNTANMIAEELNGDGFDITVVDSCGYSMFIGKPVLNAAEMIKNGKTKEEIIEYLKDCYAHDSVYFMVDELEHLKRGGRIKATTMAISKMLDIKPILKINDGLVEAFSKVRGKKKAVSTLVDIAEEKMENPQDSEAYILHSELDDCVDILKLMLKDRLGLEDVVVYDIGAIVTSHTGVGVLGLGFRHKR